ncbi:SAG-related sequence [Besnoitia besnoiti]|uniref:SAG-related sequence n=1 Tax=Besnoitia besnoiti TaxID=94643 RepID=A0A2A9ML58_BESBE|nr:SAG-related sequence [Besnoitia besnoiti]PFH37041.1 SAG-related sequence [Besnoitia besnoiti]
MGRKGGVQRQRSGFRAKARKLVALCVGGVLLLSADSQALAGKLEEGSLRREVVGGQGPSGPSAAELCRATTGSHSEERSPSEGSDPKRLSVTLSKEHLTTTVECVGAQTQPVPTAVEDACVATATLDLCATSGKKTLQAILEAPDKIAWTKTDTPVSGQGEGRILRLKEADLPFADKHFFVGCETSNPQKKTCKIDITVKARASSVDKNVVTCAYGAESNPRALEAEMTEENNTLTIKCGKDGNIKPANYQDRYCEDEKLSPCSRSYKDILPRFDSSWWTKEGEAPAAETLTLTIPKEEFPAEEQKIYVGCAPSSEGGEEKALNDKEEEPENVRTDPKLCRVLVTVRAGSAATTLRSSVLGTAAVSSATVVAGLLFYVF